MSGVSAGSPQAAAIAGTSIQYHSPLAGLLSGTNLLLGSLLLTTPCSVTYSTPGSLQLTLLPALKGCHFFSAYQLAPRRNVGNISYSSVINLAAVQSTQVYRHTCS